MEPRLNRTVYDRRKSISQANGRPWFSNPVARKPLNRFWSNLLTVITSWTPPHTHANLGFQGSNGSMPP